MDYKPNSHRSKDENKPKLDKVISGTAKIRKKSSTRKFTDVFISEDASNVKSYIITDVVIPAAKKLISDIIRDGIEMLLYGSISGSKRSSKSGYVAYDRFSDPRDSRRDTRSESRSRFDFNDVAFETRGEAEMVLSQMGDVIERYGVVTVADMYDLAGLTEPYTSNKYGWTSIRSADVVRSRDGGYIIKLPRPMAID